MKIPNSPIFTAEIYVHNLMVNPDDIPSDSRWVLNEVAERVYYGGDGEWHIFSDYYDDEDCIYATPKLWYDIPQFDTDTTELEKLSKEELIELIIKERGNK